MRSERTSERPLLVAGANPVLEALRSDAPIERVLLGPGPRRDELLAAIAHRGVPHQEVDRPALERLAGRPVHQGAVAVLAAYRYAALEDMLDCGEPVVVLDQVQDPRNLGALLRTARAAGVGGVVLPRDRSVGVTPIVVAASAGAVFGIRVARVTNLARALRDLKEGGFWLVALVPSAPASLFELDLPARPALVIGGEGEGLRPLVRRTCDFEARIPMAPGVESLNVSVAAGVALFELRRRAGRVR